MREQFLERLDFGQIALAQALFLLGRQAAERLAAAVTEVPNARALEQVADAVRLMTLQPVHHLAAPCGRA